MSHTFNTTRFEVTWLKFIAKINIKFQFLVLRKIQFLDGTKYTLRSRSRTGMVYTSVSQPSWGRGPLNSFFIRRGPGSNRLLVNTFPFFKVRTLHLLTPWCRVLLEKLTDLQLVKKFPAFHGTRGFITALTSVRQLSLSWTSPIQSLYTHPTSWRSVLILSTHLRLCLPSDLLPSGFPTKTLYTPLSSPIRATCPANLILLDFITRTILGEEYKSFSSSLVH